jgi:hypothetical protein
MYMINPYAKEAAVNAIFLVTPAEAVAVILSAPPETTSALATAKFLVLTPVAASLFSVTPEDQLVPPPPSTADAATTTQPVIVCTSTERDKTEAAAEEFVLYGKVVLLASTTLYTAIRHREAAALQVNAIVAVVPVGTTANQIEDTPLSVCVCTARVADTPPIVMLEIEVTLEPFGFAATTTSRLDTAEPIDTPVKLYVVLETVSLTAVM